MKAHRATDGIVMIWCPGCNEAHGVNARWTFNGDYARPTFTPSILVRSTKFTDRGEADYEKWAAAGHPDRGEQEFDHADTVCHSFVTDGRIQFLADCTHELAGQTVELPEWEES